MNPLIIAYISLSSALIPLSIGVFQWNRLSNKLKLVVCIPLTALLADFISLVFLNYQINTWPVLNLFFLIQFSLLFFILSHEENILLKVLFYICFAFAVLNYLFLQTPKTFNSFTAYAGGILIIITALVFLYKLLEERPVEKVQTLPLFWVAFGTLIYHAGTLFLFLFNNYLVAHQPESHQFIWILHNMLNITKNGFLFIALWLSYRTRISPQ